MERLWLPWSLLGVVDSLELLVRGVEVDLGVTTLGALVGEEDTEDFPEDTEETEDRGVLCLLLIVSVIDIMSLSCPELTLTAFSELKHCLYFHH